MDDGQRLFLNVKRSVGGRRWVDRLPPGGDIISGGIAERANIPDLVARIMAARGVEADGAARFLDPTIKGLMPDPHCLQDMDVAADRLRDAILNGEQVAIFGDYDVDGATSSALLFRFLSACGLKPTIYIPDRILEGYGPNPEAIDHLVEAGATLIVTVDCGATSFDALDRAVARGVDVVVLDHHQMGVDLPTALALVNPNRQDDLSGLGHLAAVGVTFMALVAVARVLRDAGSGFSADRLPNLLTYLDLVALGTVCDVVPLKGLNRAFVVKGLLAMRTLQNAGLAALSRVARVDGPLSAYHLGFLLGPRINAGGRIGDAALGARLLTIEDPTAAAEMASTLDRLNSERQALEKDMLLEADSQAFAELGGEGDGEGGPSVLITSSDGWHPGIAGIVASRLKDRYHRPAFALAFDANGLATGSGRSISDVDLGRAVRAAVDAGVLIKGGGHAMAAGLTVARDRLADLRAFFEEQLSDDVIRARSTRSLPIDGALTARAATFDLYEAVERAGPYGAGHPQPVFAFPSHRLSYVDVVGNGHVKATIKTQDGSSLPAICFRAADTPLGQALLNGRQQVMHFAGSLSQNTWQGRTSLQLRVIDVAKPDGV
ncbi:MAG: single-stranded-DNA-specific exonuclease RecJ [Pseudomonadota bacterium]